MTNVRRISSFLVGVTVLWMGLTVAAQNSSRAFYSESFKKGATRIAEQNLDITLTADRPKQDFPVNDISGKQRYILRFVPDTPRGDTRILGWFVRLVDLHHKIYDSVLPASPDLSRDTMELWWLDGRQYAKVPLHAARVFKLEQFYCVLQVKDVKRVAPGQPYLNQINIAVHFTNTKP